MLEDLQERERVRPSPGPWRRTVRVLVVVSVALVLGGGALALAAFALSSASSPSQGALAIDAAMARLAAGAAALLLAWWSVGLLACVVTACAGPAQRTVSTRVAESLPRPLRLAVTAALGVAISAGTVVPAAMAAPAPTMAAVQLVGAGSVVDPAWSSTTASGVGSLPAVDGAKNPATGDLADSSPLESLTHASPDRLEPGWAPSRPAAVREAPDVGLVVQQPRPATVLADEVVVHRGDTLWDISARHLPVGATDSEIAAEWPRWYDANRDVLGDDPDHIEPGQRLRAPAAG